MTPLFTMGWGLRDPHPSDTQLHWGPPPPPEVSPVPSPPPGVTHRLELLQPVLHGVPKGWRGTGGVPVLAHRRDGGCRPRSSLHPGEVAGGPVPCPCPQAGAVPALIPRDGHKEGAEGRDELEPPFTWDTWGHRQRLWVPAVTPGGDSDMRTDVGWPQLGSDGEVCPHECHAPTCPSLLCVASLGDMAGDAGHGWGWGTWLGTEDMAGGHNYG